MFQIFKRLSGATLRESHSKREKEKRLRDAGYSRTEAKQILSTLRKNDSCAAPEVVAKSAGA